MYFERFKQPFSFTGESEKILFYKIEADESLPVAMDRDKKERKPFKKLDILVFEHTLRIAKDKTGTKWYYLGMYNDEYCYVENRELSLISFIDDECFFEEGPTCFNLIGIPYSEKDIFKSSVEDTLLYYLRCFREDLLDCNYQKKCDNYKNILLGTTVPNVCDQNESIIGRINESELSMCLENYSYYKYAAEYIDTELNMLLNLYENYCLEESKIEDVKIFFEPYEKYGFIFDKTM